MASEVDQRGRTREQALVRLASRQHGVITLAQLRLTGFSPSGVRTRVAAGRLHRVQPRVYALGRPDLSTEGRWLAAVMSCGPDAVLSHRSAAALHELLPTAQARIDITVPRRSGLSRRQVRIHRSLGLAGSDRSVVRAIPCTAVPRTLLDLASVLHRRAFERACDQAEVLGVLDMNAVRDLLARSEGRPGVRRLRAVLEAGEVGKDIPRSELEERFLRLCRRSDLRLPEVNVWMTVEGEEMELDFVWRKQRVVVEVDGFRTHRTRLAFQRDRRRDQLLTLGRWQVVRFTWDEITKEPGHVTEVLRRLI